MLGSDIFSIIMKRNLTDLKIQISQDKTCVNAVDENGWSPLMYLARFWQDGDDDIIRLLVESGADINAADFLYGNTALHVACYLNNVKFIKALQRAARGVADIYYYLENFAGKTAPDIALDKGEYGLLVQLAKGRFKKLRSGEFDICLAVVGVGPAGAALFINLVQRLVMEQNRRNEDALLNRIKILLIDRNSRLGTGTPYSDEKNSPTSLLNIAAGGMSILADDPDDFFKWLKYKETSGELAEILGPAYDLGLCKAVADRSAFYPRLTYGRYVTECLAGSMEVAEKHGITVLPLPMTEVIKEVPGEDGTRRLTLAGPTIDGFVDVTNVYYATGHWVEATEPGKAKAYTRSPRYIPFPANVATLESLGLFDRPCHIAILGSALSAIDAIYSILLHPKVGRLSHGTDGLPVYEFHEGWKVTCYSRRGLLPRVRPIANEDFKLRYLNPRNFRRLQAKNNGHLSLNKVIQLLNLECSEIFGREIDVRREADPLRFNQSLRDNKDPFVIVARDLEKALHGDGSSGKGYARWYQIMHALFPIIRMAYRQFTREEREEFDSKYNSQFLWAFAPMPYTSAQNLIAMHDAGALDVRPVAPGSGPQFDGNNFIISSLDLRDRAETNQHPFLIGTTGLANVFYRDVSPLTQQLISTGAFDLHDPRTIDRQSLDTSAFIADDGSFEILDITGDHSSIRRGVGFFLHAQLFDVQAVPSVVKFGDRIARIYTEEFLYSRLGDDLYLPYYRLAQLRLLMEELRHKDFKHKL